MIRPNQRQSYWFGDVVADPNRLEVKRGGEVVDLEPKALRVLFYLIENRDRVVNKEELIQAIWAGAFVTDNSLTRVIAQVRKQLGDNARAPRYIQTSATTGYRFIGELISPAGPVALPQMRAPVPRPRRRWLLAATIVGAGAIIAAAAAIWWISLRFGNSAPRMVALQQITSSVALDRWPAFSPDGSQMAFTSDRSGLYEIYTRSVAPGSSERQITFDDQENIQPTWSPDGAYIAYVSIRRGGINIIPASGGSVRYRTDFGDSPQWSPDGRWLVFRDTGRRGVNPAQDPIDIPDATLWLVGADRGAPKRLTKTGSPPGVHSSPRWLADSRHVVFETAVLVPPTTPRPDFVTVVTNTQNGTWQTIPLPGLRARNPIVSPDLRFLYFEVRLGTRPGLWRVRIDGNFQPLQPETVIPMNGPLLRDLTFNANGTLLAFSQTTDRSAIWSVPLTAECSAAGEPKPLIQEHIRRLTDPVFSPDGSKIAYTWTQRDSEFLKMAIYSANADGSGATSLTAADQQGFLASWMGPNSVAYEVPEKGGAGYWVKPIDGPPKRTRLRLDWNRADRLRLHGTKVAAEVATAAGLQVVVGDIDGGAPRALTPPDRHIGDPCWSPDGRWIAATEVIHGDSTVVVFPSSGGEIRTLVSEPAQSLAHDWSPDSRRITFAGLRRGTWNVYWVDRLTREVRQLTHFATPSAFVRYPAWSPQGDQVIFERYDQSANIYIANFR